MALHNMPQLGTMLMPGAGAYGDECIRLATLAANQVRVEWDVAYGPDPYQQLDIWLPEKPEGAPVLLFIHGGAFRNGHKEWNGAHAPTVTAAGAILVSPNYRLVPGVRIADAIADCFDALAWVRQNIASRGGDPDRLLVGGHSAGAHLAGMLAVRQADLAARGIPAAAVRACLSVSGVFNAVLDELAADSIIRRFHAQYFAGPEEARAATLFTHLADCPVPFHVAYGEHEPADLLADNRRLVAATGATGRLLGMDVVAGADHFAAHLACLDPQGPWLAKLRSLLA